MMGKWLEKLGKGIQRSCQGQLLMDMKTALEKAGKLVQTHKGQKLL